MLLQSMVKDVLNAELRKKRGRNELGSKCKYLDVTLQSSSLFDQLYLCSLVLSFTFIRSIFYRISQLSEFYIQFSFHCKIVFSVIKAILSDKSWLSNNSLLTPGYMHMN